MNNRVSESVVQEIEPLLNRTTSIEEKDNVLSEAEEIHLLRKELERMNSNFEKFRETYRIVHGLF